MGLPEAEEGAGQAEWVGDMPEGPWSSGELGLQHCTTGPVIWDPRYLPQSEPGRARLGPGRGVCSSALTILWGAFWGCPHLTDKQLRLGEGKSPVQGAGSGSQEAWRWVLLALELPPGSPCGPRFLLLHWACPWRKGFPWWTSAFWTVEGSKFSPSHRRGESERCASTQ